MPASPSFMLPACLLVAALLSHAPATEFIVTSDTEAGPGSLRQAILDANAAPGSDTILFTRDPLFTLDRSWGAFAQITVAGALPDITDPVIIEGSFNPGQHTVITAVEITSTGLAAGQSLLTVTSGGSSLRACPAILHNGHNVPR